MTKTRNEEFDMDASAILDDRQMLEASKEFELWRRARRLASVSKLLHVYMIGSLIMLALRNHVSDPWGIVVGFATAAVALHARKLATAAGDDPPRVEHRLTETGRLQATSNAVSLYAMLVAFLGAASVVVHAL